MLNTPEQSCKVDLHVHSCQSLVEDGFLQQITQSESYTLPSEIYKLAKKRNMDFVTITDHNSINGVREIAHLPGVFVGEEVTVQFPEDGCAVHVGVLNITEEQHREIQRLRSNIYELLDYVRQEDIVHFIAHPLSSVNGKLRVPHWEKILLLFKTVEAINGVQKEKDNVLLQKLLSQLTPERMEILANRYDLVPYGEEPWNKVAVAGSDDHGGLYVARTYTRGRGPTIDTFLESVRVGACSPAGKGGTYSTLGHSIYAVGYRFFRQNRGQKVFWRLIDAFIDDEKKGKLTERIFTKKKRLGFSLIPRNLILSHLMRRFSRQIPLLGAFESLRRLNRNAPSYAVLLPYLFGFFYQNKDRPLARQIEQEYLAAPKVPKVALFSDFGGTPDEMQAVEGLPERTGDGCTERLHLFFCNGKKTRSARCATVFRSVAEFPLPFVKAIRLQVPPLIDVLNLCEQRDFSVLHVLSPGPVGAAGILAGKILRIPVVVSYHIDFVRALAHTRDDSVMKDVAWWYLKWFYRQADAIIAGPEQFPPELREACQSQRSMHEIPELDNPCFFLAPAMNPARVISALLASGMLEQLWRVYEKVNRGEASAAALRHQNVGFSFS